MNSPAPSGSAQPPPTADDALHRARDHDEIKRQLFARAAEIRGSNGDNYAKIAGFAVLAARRRGAGRRRRRATQLVDCRGHATLRLPAGLAVAGGRTTLSGDIGYSVAPGAARRRSTLGQSDAIAIPLATLDAEPRRAAAPTRRAAAGADPLAPGAAPRPSAAPAAAAAPAAEASAARAPELRLPPRAHSRRARGVRQSRARRARPRHGGAISQRASPTPTRRSARLLGADPRPLPRLSRPLRHRTPASPTPIAAACARSTTSWPGAGAAALARSIAGDKSTARLANSRRACAIVAAMAPLRPAARLFLLHHARRARSSPRRSPSMPRGSAFPPPRWSTATASTPPCRSATPASPRACSRSSARCSASRGPPTSARAGALDWLVLLAQDEAGYDNLCRLVSAAHLDRPITRGAARRASTRSPAQTDGLIALTAGGEGALARLFADGQDDKAEAYADRLAGAVPRPALHRTVAPRRRRSRRRPRRALIDLAYALDLPLVATNPACYAEPDFHAAHDAMLCIAASTYVDNDDRKTSSPEAWLKPAADMEALFADLPEAIANTAVIAQRCAVAAPQAQADPAAPQRRRGRDAAARGARRARPSGSPRSPVERPRANLSRPPRFRDRRHHPHGLRRLLPDRRRLHQMGQGQRHSGRPGPRVGRGQRRRLGADDHRPRPDRARPAVRTLPQPRTRVDARFRHRFLRNPPRQGHHLRPAEIWPRPGGADHHLRAAEGARRAQGHRARAADELWPGRPPRQARSPTTRPIRGTCRARSTASASSHAEYKNDAERAAPARPGDEARRPAAPQLDPCRRRGHRRPPAGRAGPALPRPALGHAGDPVRHEICRGGGAGEVRFPRAEDAVGAQGRPAPARAAAASTVDFDRAARGTIRRSTNCSSAATRSACSSSNPKACGARSPAVRPTAFGDIIALVSLYRPGPMDNIPMFGDRKNGRAELAYPHPMLEGVLKETYGIFVYQEQVMQAAQVLAGYSLGEADLLRRAMGKKIQSEMNAQRARFVEGAAANDIAAGQGQRTVRLDRQVRRLWLQQEPRRRLRAGRLSHRLAEGASPGRYSSPRR